MSWVAGTRRYYNKSHIGDSLPAGLPECNRLSVPCEKKCFAILLLSCYALPGSKPLSAYCCSACALMRVVQASSNDSSATNTWLDHHPAVAAFFAVAILVVPALLFLRRSVALWRHGALLSVRLEGWRDASAALYWVCMPPLLLWTPANWQYKPSAVLYGTLACGLGVGISQLLVVVVRRREKQWDDQSLREQGLPVRHLLTSWKLTALLCYLAMPVIAIVTVLTLGLPLTLVLAAVGASEETLSTAGIAVGAAAICLWIVGSGYLVIRQYRRQRTADKRYWEDFRARQREVGR